MAQRPGDFDQYWQDTLDALAGYPACPDHTAKAALFRLLEFLTHGPGAVYFLHESLHGAGAPEAMRILLRREVPMAPFEAAARRLMAH